MNPPPACNPYKRHRVPAEIISHGVWLYFRFCLSDRDAEEVMAARGVLLTDEAVRYWCRQVGQMYAHQLRHRRPRPGAKWHLAALARTINKARHYLWRAVDQEGHVLDILVQCRRDKRAAKRVFRKLLTGLTDVPRVVITEQLCGYSAAQRERRMQRFKSPGHAQRFLAYGSIVEHFRPRRHLCSAPEYRQKMAQQCQTWREITGTARVA